MGVNIVEFICIPELCTYNSEEFKIYGTYVDIKEYPNIKLNKYNNVTILGNLHELGVGIEYKVKAEEQKSNYGHQYKVVNIKRQKPTNLQQTKLFLYEILTYNQVETLTSVYPDIVDKVINDKLDDVDLNLTKGIKDYTFDVIKRKIIENFALAELVEEFQGMIPFSMVKKLYDKYPSLTRIRIELKNNPYKCLCGLSRVGFKTADSLILSAKEVLGIEYDIKTSEQRMKACIINMLEENENQGNTKIEIKELRSMCKKLTPACIDHFVNIIKIDEDIYFDKETKFISLKSTYEIEEYIAKRLIEGLKQNTEWNFDIEKYKIIEGIELTDQQFKAIENLCKYNISILNGYAGVGKSQTTNTIIKMLKDNKKSFELFAPTGRAAKVLSGYTNENASTVHRGLGYMPPNDWSYNENNKLPCDVLIVDEFSMVDTFMMKKLIEAIDFSKTKLLIIGDSFQIPSVSAGNTLHDLVNSKLIPTTTLTKVFRYGEGGLMTIATKTRMKENFIDNNLNNVKVFGVDKSYIFVPINQNTLLKNILGLYKKLLKDGESPEDILILSAYNKGDYGTIAINNKIQKIANKNYGNGEYIKIGDTEFYKDDIVIQTINNYKARLYDNDYGNDIWNSNNTENVTFIPNGDIGKVKIVDKRYVIVSFDNDDIVYSREEATQLKLAYSISMHKSQGGSCKNIILITPKAHTYMLNANLMYVGQTRTKKNCYHLGEPITINRAIKKQENFNRKTFLKDLLNNIQ